jgi:hypothetical protein
MVESSNHNSSVRRKVSAWQVALSLSGAVTCVNPSSTAAKAEGPAAVQPQSGAQLFGDRDALVTLGAVDPQGRWAFFCQANANSNDAMALGGAKPSFVRSPFEPYLSRAHAETVKVDSLAAASPDGRYIVVISASSGPQLIDTAANRIESLASLDLDMRADVTLGDLRSIAFSPDSTLLALLVHEKQPRIIVRNLQTNTQSEVVPVGNAVWRIGFDASTKYVVASEIVDDTNGNGRRDWPYPERKSRESRCMAPIPAHAAYYPTGDIAETSIAPVRGGPARMLAGFVAAIGQSLVVKLPGGGLSAIEGTRTKAFSSPDCDAQILAVAPASGRIVTGCRDGKGRSDVEVDSAQGYKRLAFDVPSSSVDWVVPQNSRYVAFYSGAQSVLVDVSEERVLPLMDRDQVLAQGQSGVLVRRGNEIVLFYPKTQASVSLLGSVVPGTRIVVGEHVVQAGNTVVSADQGRVLGTLAKPAMAIASNGCGLVSLGQASAGDRIARGPLSWSCPVR